jgi:hypothetical protein
MMVWWFKPSSPLAPHLPSVIPTPMATARRAYLSCGALAIRRSQMFDHIVDRIAVEPTVVFKPP